MQFQERKDFREKEIKENDFFQTTLSLCCAEFQIIVSAETSCIVKAVSCCFCLTLVFQSPESLDESKMQEIPGKPD